MYEYPDFFARFYDIIYAKVRSETDTEYFLNKIKQCKGKVLEVGVGTGRFFIDALKQGADIYGIDISPSMVDVLKSKLDTNEHFRVKVADIANYSDKQKYDLIIAPFRVFGHLLEVESQLNALNNINDLLTENGVFIFDLFVPNLEMLNSGIKDLEDFNEEFESGKTLKRIINMESDLINQRSKVTFKLVWTEDGKEHSDEWYTEIRYFFRFEIEHLIKRSKLELIDIYGDYLQNLLDAKSQDFVVHCKTTR